MKKVVLLTMLVALQIIVKAQPTTVGLIAHFPFNGNTTNSGPANVTAVGSNISYTTNNVGTANTAVQFQGNLNSVITFTDNGNFDFTGTNNFTITLGFFFNGSSTGGLFDNCLNYGGPGVWLWSTVAGTWNLQGNYKNNSVGSSAGTSFTPNQWNHVAFVRNNGTISIYINGVFKLSATEGTTAPTYPIDPIAGAMGYGGYTPPRYNPFGGKFDELRVYNRALTTSEIAAINTDFVNGGVQPVTISCPSNITVSNTPGQCGANVTYPAATATGTPAPTISYSKASGSFFSVGNTIVTATATNATGSSASCSFTVTVTGGVDTDSDGIADVCDLDDDGDLTLDESDCAPLDPTKWRQALLYIDNDNDGYTNGQQTICYGANIPTGYKANSLGSDCNDNNVLVWQSASLYIDNDNDGYTNGQQVVCYGASIPIGFKANSLGSDCNDNNVLVWQSASLYVDNDNDGYTNGQQVVCYGASIPVGFKATSLGIDCNDNNNAIHPGATEICNDIDDDCDGSVDEGFINTVVTCPFTGIVTKNLQTGCVYTVNGNEFNATVTQNCGPLGYTLTGATTGSGVSLANVQLNTGTTTVTWSATNANDQSFSCSFNVYVVPAAPAIVCPQNIIVPATNGQCGAVVNYTTPALPNLCANNDNLPPTTQTFNYTGQVVDWVVPNGVTSVVIEAKGAQGGDNVTLNGLGGKGTVMKGTFSVTPGQTIKIIVGQRGFNNTGGNAFNGAGGGGGGSFIWLNNSSTPMLVAGGGGGSCLINNGSPHYLGKDASVGNSGTGSRSNDIFNNAPGGVGGNSGPDVCGGKGWSAVLLNPSGVTTTQYTYGADGGYGGGGAAGKSGPSCNSLHVAGGGGGYSGGGSGGTCYYHGGGGGGSFNSGTDQVNSVGNIGNGQVIITYGSVSSSVTQTSGLPSGSNFAVGTTTNTFLITDAFGQTSNCSFTVTVNDEQAPTVTQPNNITVANAIGQCSASVNFSATATDNCSVTSLKYYLQYNTPNQEEISFPKTFAVGSYVVTVVAKDAANNTTTKTFTITVDDTEKPTVTKGSIGSCYSSVAAAEAAALEATTYSDNCSSFEELDVDVSTDGTCNAVITITVTDASDNSRSVTYNTRIDNTAPVLSLTPGNATVNCHQVPSVPTITANDNCEGSVNVSFTPSSTQGSDPTQSDYYNYTITRKWFATDGCGNTVEHVQTITVRDVTAPTLTCPANIVVSNETGLCSAQVTFNATSSDLCSTPTVKYYLYYGTPEQQEISSPWTFAVGSYTVKVVSTDPTGNSNNCTFTVTVNDTEKPNVTKGSIGSCYKTVALAEAAALAATTYSDNCTPNASLNVQVATLGTCSAEITVTVTDAANNSRSVTYNTRIDNTSPVLSLMPASTIVNCHQVPSVPTVTANDNCDGSVNVTFTPTSTQGSDPTQSNYYNYTINRKWFATDGCGNTVEHVQTITVQDVTAPTLTCPANIIVSNETGLCSAKVTFNATSSDLCSTPLVKYYLYYGTPEQQEISSPRTFAVGSYTVKVVSTDPSGNSNNCTFTVTVNDTEKPNVTKGSIGSCYKTVALAEAAALAATTYSDNCTPNAQLNVSVATVGTCSAEITATVKDAANNSRSVTYNTRIDNTAPVLSLTPANVTVNCQSVPPVPTVTASDNCDGTVNVTFTPISTQGSNPAQSNYYNYILTCKWYATDGCGNTVEHVQTITVQDITDPVITCPANKLSVPFDFGQLYATIVVGAATATDNCAAASNITIGGTRSDNVAITNQQYPLGQTTVAWTATDPSGNSDDCTQTITVRKRNISVTYTGEMTDNKIVVQYSDIINLQAKLTDNEGLVTPNNISGRTIIFQLLSGTTVLRSKSATTNASGVAVDTFKVEQAPGAYTVKTIFAGDSYFNGSNDQDNCEVKQEDAVVEYNGSQYFTTSSATTMGGSVTLVASLNDIDDGSDKRGDIRKSKATFRDGGPSGNVLGSANLTVGLVTPGTLTNGLSATTQSYTLNSNEAGSGGKIFQVWVGASDHYKGADAGPTPVTLALPGQDFVTGGGHLVVTNSAGTYAGTVNSKMNFGFTMKWNKSGKNLQGNINIVFRKWQLYNGVWQWRVYQAKSNAVNSMAVVEVGSNGQPVSGTNPAAFRKAIINTKANLKDVTDPLNNIDLGGNHNLSLDAWDHITANGGTSDKINVTLMGSTTNELLFSSGWSSNATQAQTITGGNVNVRNGSGSAATTKNEMTKNAQMESSAVEVKDEFIVKAYPNPFQHQFTLIINTKLNEAVQIQIYDAAGRKIQMLSAKANEAIQFGEKLKAGIYIAEVIQGTKRETIKLIKQ
jgi:Fe-S cluster assembly iron-binding protein IscA